MGQVMSALSRSIWGQILRLTGLFNMVLRLLRLFLM